MALQTIATLGPLHGHTTARLEHVSTGALRLNLGTLHPCLTRLAQPNRVRAQWDKTSNNRRARFYTITAAGRANSPPERWNGNA